MPPGPRYLVCNADEGAFMDRAILAGDPHRVAEKEARQQRAADEMADQRGIRADRRARSHRQAVAAPPVRRCRAAAYASSAES
jgi:hypothetical protein